MGLRAYRTFMGYPPLNYGDTVLCARLCTTFGLVFAALAVIFAIAPAAAQQARSPGFNTRQTEKYFDDQRSRQQRPAVRSDLRVPRPARPQPGTADTKPLFV